MRRTLVGLFLISLTSLLVELLLTRIFDVILLPNLAFLIISCAIFGLGLGGLFDILTPRSSRSVLRSSLGNTALFFAVCVWAIPLLLNLIPFSLDRIARQPVTQLAWFLLLYLVLLAPFFFAGLCVCRIFSAGARDIHRLYFWDLTGAAVGTAILVPLLPPLGPARLMMVVALAALGAAALLTEHQSHRFFGTLALLFLVVPFTLGPRYLTLALHDNKRDVQHAIELGRLEFSRWDPVSEIAVLDEPPKTTSSDDHGRKHVAYDGGTQSSDFFPFDGDFAALRRDLPHRLMFQFWRRGVLVSHYLRRDTGHTALIIGSAGGQETKAALLYGASQVDAVEMVGTMVDLATGRYAPYIGRLFEQPAVHVHVAEGRSFLRASRTRYDVIEIFSNYTSSGIASGSGALSPAYLLTTDAFREYFAHLKPDGILHINHLAYPRIVTTAAATWQAIGGTAFRSHVLVFERKGPEPDFLPTILIKMTPWTAAEVDDAKRFFAFPADHEMPYTLVENPLDPAQSFLPDVFYGGRLPASILAVAPYDPRPVTDARPFFQFMRRSFHPVTPSRDVGLNTSTAAVLNDQLRSGWLPMDWVHIIVATAASLFYGVLFVLLPMLGSPIGRQPWRGKSATLVYFSLLGLAFIAIELVFIQIFMKLIGYPLYAVTTVITIMLFGAGLGSMTVRRVAGPDGARWHFAFAGLIVTGLSICVGYGPISARFLAAGMTVRIGVAATMIFPLAFFMGMPFPLGIRELQSKPQGAIAWAWSMNGLFTTIGGVATAASSLWIGFQNTAVAAFAVYAVAWIAFAILRRSGRRAAVSPCETGDPLRRPIKEWRLVASWVLRQPAARS